MSVADIDICDTPLSDHRPVFFSSALPAVSKTLPAQVRWSRILTRVVFAELYLEAGNLSTANAFTSCLEIDKQRQIFNNKCSNILDSVAPRKLAFSRNKRQPWMNGDIRLLRQHCRRHERKWKKDKLQVSFEMLHVSLQNFQKAVRVAKNTLLSDITANNSNCSRTLFSILNPPILTSSAISPSECENFPKYFSDKISTRPQVFTTTQPVFDPTFFLFTVE